MIARQEEIDGKWFCWVVTDGLNCTIFESDHELTQEEADQKLLEWRSSQIVIEEIPSEPIN